MKLGWITIFLAGITLSIFAAEPDQNADWRLIKESSGISIYSRPHNGSNLKEFKAIAEIDASSKAVHSVINDVAAYPSFMPYTKECRVIREEKDSTITYQRLSPKIVGDRDYTIRVQEKSWPAENGLTYSSCWEPANDQGPSEIPGVFRGKSVNGSWLLEPVASDKTRATYFVFTDSGISVPQFLANTINEMGISKLFAALRQQAKKPKYQG